MMDWDTLVTGPVHTIFGTDAMLTLGDGTEITLTDAIDQTAGVAVGDNVETQTIEPAADVRKTDLAEVDLADLRDATLVINGRTWTVRNHRLMQTPGGYETGQVRLMLRKSS